MASLGITLNKDDLPEGDNFDLIPEGWYQASIKVTELKETNAKDGQYIKLQYAIQGPTHAGRVVFGNLNIKNRNPEAERIGMQQLGMVMGAIGLPSIQDTDQLIGGNLMIKVGLGKKQEGYDQRNEVKGWKAIEGGMPPAAKVATPAASTGSAPPWAKKPGT